MGKWLRRLLLGPEMTLEERATAIQCIEGMMGVKVFHMDGQAAFQFIKEHGFPVRKGDGNYVN